MNGRQKITFAMAFFHIGILVTLPAAWGQDGSAANTTSDRQSEVQEWTGKWADGSVLTRADLDEILRLHSRWLETDGAEGEEADFRGCTLSNADLVGANLAEVWLTKANLTGAKLIGANLTGANLNRADLTSAYLVSANLIEAFFLETDLTDARLDEANLDGAVFDPKADSLPYIPYLASTKNLDKLRYRRSETGLVELRNALRQAGLRRQERQVNYALLRGRREKMQTDPRGFGDRADAAFNYVFFEITCKYGMLPGRPLQIMGVAVLVFAAPYFWVLRRKERSSRSDIWLEVEDENIRPNRKRKRRMRLLANAGAVLPPRARIKRFRRTLFAALYFSLLTTFRVGFREINVGNWITRMQFREYAIRATGWVRCVTGLQSLLSVALLALWLVSYFGRPFE